MPSPLALESLEPESNTARDGKQGTAVWPGYDHPDSPVHFQEWQIMVPAGQPEKSLAHLDNRLWQRCSIGCSVQQQGLVDRKGGVAVGAEQLFGSFKLRLAGRLRRGTQVRKWSGPRLKIIFHGLQRSPASSVNYAV